MADDVVFKLTTVYDGAQLAQGMGASTSVIQTDTAAWKEAFSQVSEQMLGSNEALIASIQSLTAKIDTIPIATKRAAEESAGALTVLQEKLAMTGEAALSAANKGAGFAGIASILGGGALIGLVGHFLDETSKEVIQLGLLSDKTGIAIESLSGLQLVTREMGVDFQTVETGMIRLSRAQALAVEGGKMQQEAFARLGITLNELKSATPEELFDTFSAAVQRSRSSADVAASSFALLGRGGAALIPIFRQYGGTLDEVIKKEGEETGVNRQAYEEAIVFHKAMVDLGDILRKIAIESIPVLVTGFHYFIAGIDEARAAVGQIVVTIQQYSDDAQQLDSALHFKQSWSEAFQHIRDNADLARLSIAQINSEASKAVNQDLGIKASGFEGTKFNVVDQLGIGGPGRKPSAGDEDVPSGAGAPPGKDTRLKEWKLQLQRMEDASNASHIVMQSQELVFWDNILNTQKLNTAQELEIRHTVATLNKDITREMHEDVMQSYQEQAVLAGDGSKAQIAALQNLYDYAVAVYGPVSKEAVRAYEEIQKAAARSAEEQIKELSAVAKTQAKVAEDALVQKQKELDAEHEEEARDIVTTTKQRVDTQGGGTGAIGSVVELTAARSQMEQLIAAEEEFKAKSIANAQAISAEKLAALDKERAAYQADMAVNAENAEKDRSKMVEIDQQITLAKAAELTKEQELVRAASQQELQYQQQYAEQVQRTNDQIASKLASTTDAMIFQSKNFHAAVTKLWQDLVTGLIQKMVQIAAQWVAQHVIMAAIGKLFHSQEVAESATAGAAESATVAAANDAQIISYAAVAAAAAYAAYAEIPPVAAGMAAQAFATVASFTALGSAEHGAEMPGGTGPFPMLLHAREMVLPADISGGVRQMVKSGTANTQASGPSLSIGRMIFAPTVQEPFDVQTHGSEFFDFAIGKFRKLGFDV